MQMFPGHPLASPTPMPWVVMASMLSPPLPSPFSPPFLAPAPGPLAFLPPPPFPFPPMPANGSPLREEGFPGPKVHLCFTSPPRFTGAPMAPPPPAGPSSAFHMYLETLRELHDLLFNPALPPFPLPERNTRLYRVLGLEPGCTAEAVAARYKQLAMLHHPDKSGGVASGEQLKEYNAAKAVLLDAALRLEYDRFRPADQMCIECWAHTAAEHYHGSAGYFQKLVHDIHTAFLRWAEEAPELFPSKEGEVGIGVGLPEWTAGPAAGNGMPGDRTYEFEIDEEASGAGQSTAAASLADSAAAEGPATVVPPATVTADPEDQLNALWRGAGRVRHQLLQLRSGAPSVDDRACIKEQLDQCLEQLQQMEATLKTLDTLSDQWMLKTHCCRMYEEVLASLAALHIEKADPSYLTAPTPVKSPPVTASNTTSPIRPQVPALPKDGEAPQSTADCDGGPRTFARLRTPDDALGEDAECHGRLLAIERSMEAIRQQQSEREDLFRRCRQQLKASAAELDGFVGGIPVPSSQHSILQRILGLSTQLNNDLNRLGCGATQPPPAIAAARPVADFQCSLPSSSPIGSTRDALT
eukprot:GGOE01003949.1.p1 GENE.GGOE01003949.1~~GGOE01003949.1.p1  ORF type:complete len:583 (+),score=128.74 GGOE01003949.1:60-1808(+)